MCIFFISFQNTLTENIRDVCDSPQVLTVGLTFDEKLHVSSREY